ncbi:class I SAM-dependent methyltransferase [Candidatus Peregrinibacteria bacterium]|nr:class I SAM-dependent methyltransferase [Candidatus Peregrinibacteria bacterium]
MQPTFSQDWFTGHIPHWKRLLEEFVGRPALRFCEVGSFEGRSATWLLQNILTDPTARLTCIDTFVFRAADYTHDVPAVDISARFDRNIAVTGAAYKVRKLVGPSRVILRTLPVGTFDFIYIDGSHRAPDVLTDAVLAWDLLKEDGMLLFDDYGFQALPEAVGNPSVAIDAFLHMYRGSYEILHRGWQLALRRSVAAPVPVPSI